MIKKLPYVESFRGLLVYNKSLELADKLFQTTKEFPKEEIYSLTNQIRQSSRSIGAQIAEAWGKRRYIRHFISKLTDASAEVFETEHWIDIALSCGYINNQSKNELYNLCIEINRLLGGMISKADQFCD